MMKLMRWAAVFAVLLAFFAASCSDDDEAERLDELTTDVWIDQVANFEVPEFCSDPDREEQLPELLASQYGVGDGDVEAVAERLIERCLAAG